MPQVQGIDFHFSSDTGGLIIYCPKIRQGDTFTAKLQQSFHAASAPSVREFSAGVVKRTIDGEETYAAVFPALPAGTYYVATYTISVFPGHVAEFDIRRG